MIPFEKGVSNYTYLKSFWLVSPPIMTDLLSAYSIRTNLSSIIGSQEKTINALITITNIDAKYMRFILLEYEKSQIKLKRKQIELPLFTIGGFAFGLGLTALIYHIAGNHIKEMSK